MDSGYEEGGEDGEGNGRGGGRRGRGDVEGWYEVSGRVVDCVRYGDPSLRRNQWKMRSGFGIWFFEDVLRVKFSFIFFVGL